MPYRWDLLPKLAADIEHGQTDRIPADLDDLLAAIMEDTGDDAALLSLRCAQCMSACMRGARRGGAPSETLMHDHLADLRKLARLTSPAQVRRLFRAYVLRLTILVQPAAREPMERVIRGMITDMAATIDRPRSLAHYADDLELSVGHLSRTFSRVVGRSFRDEQRRLRDEAACLLLATTRMPMAAIARRVGLLSASQFIADFKRFHGMTPAAYRKTAHASPTRNPRR